MVEITKAVIPSAGLGTRMYPITKEEPKVFMQIINKPVIQYLIEELTESGIKEVIIVSNHLTELKKYFRDDPELDKTLKKLKKLKLIKRIHAIEHLCKIDLLKDKEPRGWLHEVLFARKYLKDEPFVVCFSDNLYLSKIPATKQMIEQFQKIDKNITGGARFVFKPYIFDILEKEEFPLGSDEAHSQLFDKLEEKRDFFKFNIDGQFLDIGEPLGYLKTQTIMGLANKKIGGEYKKFLKEYLNSIEKNK